MCRSKRKGNQKCERNKVSLSSLLQSHNGGGLEAKVHLEVLCNLTNKTLQELRRLLVTTNLLQGDGTGAEPVRLLHATSCLQTTLEGSRCENLNENAYRRLLASGGGLSCELLPRGLATSQFASSLLGGCVKWGSVVVCSVCDGRKGKREVVAASEYWEAGRVGQPSSANDLAILEIHRRL